MPSVEHLNLVAIGGGTGLATLLSGLKNYLHTLELASLTAIVTVTDDGRSSGRLRDEFGLLPPGDIRQCLVALAPEQELLTRLFGYRYPGTGSLGAHSLGNLIIVALNQMSGDFLSAIDQARDLLGVKARVLPSTLDRVDIEARFGDERVRGQVEIKSAGLPITDLTLIPPDARALPEAVEAICHADLITIGPGSLFTSLIPNLLVKGIAEALACSRALKIYICNAMTEADETDGYQAEDHVQQVIKYGQGFAFDYSLFNSAPISAEMRKRYAVERAVALSPPAGQPRDPLAGRFVSLPLASEERFVRHDPGQLSRAIFEIYNHRG
jgi:uncharacterized cofD-like protein